MPVWGQDGRGNAPARAVRDRRINGPRPERRADVAGDGRPSGAGGPGPRDGRGGAAGPGPPGGTAGPERTESPGGDAGPEPTRGDKRRYFVLMGICISLFVVSWAVVDRYSVLAAVIMSAVALIIPPFAAIVANVASATDRRRR
jgi:Protein of unknown function (DUF3099)